MKQNTSSSLRSSKRLQGHNAALSPILYMETFQLLVIVLWPTFECILQQALFAIVDKLSLTEGMK